MSACAAARPLLHVVLCEPEIPNNTGNIGRTCVATGCALHLIEPLGFDVSEKACRRAGLDYWPRLDVRQHAGVEAYEEARAGARVWAFTAHAGRCVYDADLRSGDHLVFGRESTGLGPAQLARWADRLVGVPMAPGERSLNLSTAVGVVVYEAIRQMGARGELGWGPEIPGGRLNIRRGGGVSPSEDQPAP